MPATSHPDPGSGPSSPTASISTPFLANPIASSPLKLACDHEMSPAATIVGFELP